MACKLAALATTLYAVSRGYPVSLYSRTAYVMYPRMSVAEVLLMMGTVTEIREKELLIGSGPRRSAVSSPSL